MDLNTILIWTVAVSCGVMAVQLFSERATREQVFLPVTIAILLSVLVFFDPTRAGYLGGIAWFALLIFPRLGTHLLSRFLAAKRFRWAWCIAKILGWLHPFDDSRKLSHIVTALRLLDEGNEAQAVPILEALEDRPSATGRMALNLLTRVQGTWLNLLEKIDSHPDKERLLHDLMLLDAYLQALGETNRRTDLLREYQHRLLPRIEMIPLSYLATVQAKLAAFCGDELLLMQVQCGLKPVFPDEVSRYWQATARQVAGTGDSGRHLFEELVHHIHPAISRNSQRRLDVPLPSLFDQPLIPEEVHILRGVHSTVGAVVLEQAFQKARPNRATNLLLAALFIVFLCELPGGSEDYDNLVRMGAVLIPADSSGQDWWRPISAAFLHFGPLHLALNALGLAILGGQLERLWGSSRLMITYLVAAVGGIALVPYFMEPLTAGEMTILLGASGGVMGLIGGLFVQWGIMLWKHRTRAQAFRFGFLVLVIILQVIFDTTIPHISGEAHLLGLGFGIACGVLWSLLDGIVERWRSWRTHRPASS
ncbi:MAG TPA: rhomboid family intramembrane serine protease [Planctomicrobium sp.]|nr:rhomboid family intramembrane serine protease [Planctomicrobium sp.]